MDRNWVKRFGSLAKRIDSLELDPFASKAFLEHAARVESFSEQIDKCDIRNQVMKFEERISEVMHLHKRLLQDRGDIERRLDGIQNHLNTPSSRSFRTSFRISSRTISIPSFCISSRTISIPSSRSSRLTLTGSSMLWPLRFRTGLSCSSRSSRGSSRRKCSTYARKTGSSRSWPSSLLCAASWRSAFGSSRNSFQRLETLDIVGESAQVGAGAPFADEVGTCAKQPLVFDISDPERTCSGEGSHLLSG